MTREEREKVIVHGKKQLDVFGGEHANFIKYAIEALEKEPCEDAISRQYVIEKLNRVNGTAESDKLFEIVENAPSVTLTRKKGKWIIDDKEYNRIWHCHCSECKKEPQDYVGGSENWWLVQLPNYCPNCGLEMEDGE